MILEIVALLLMSNFIKKEKKGSFTYNVFFYIRAMPVDSIQSETNEFKKDKKVKITWGGERGCYRKEFF